MIGLPRMTPLPSANTPGEKGKIILHQQNRAFFLLLHISRWKQIFGIIFSNRYSESYQIFQTMTVTEKYSFSLCSIAHLHLRPGFCSVFSAHSWINELISTVKLVPVSLPNCWQQMTLNWLITFTLKVSLYWF